MKVKIINKSKNPLPQYQTEGSAGMDICANLDSAWLLAPGHRVLVPTGIYLEIPQGYECQVRSRSGLAAKLGVAVLNSPGTIDSDYRGEVGVILINLGDGPVAINNGERIAQLVFSKVERTEWETAESLETTERGDGGFGSTGK